MLIERAIVVLIANSTSRRSCSRPSSLRHRYGEVFTSDRGVRNVFSSLEYVLRVWDSDEHLPLKRHGRIGARLRYVTSPSSLVDLMAVAPSLIGFGFGVYDVNVFAVFRLLRFLKLARIRRHELADQRESPRAWQTPSCEARSSWPA